MKKIITLLIILSLSLVLFACAGNENTPEETSSTAAAQQLSAEEAAAKMAEELPFEGDLELSEFPFNTLEKYDVDTSGISDIAWYVGSGAAADELAVIKCDDDATLQAVKEALASRIDYLKDGYSDYGPDQVPKIEKALVAEYDGTVVYCICSDSDAAQTLADSIF
ncbi:MAG: DUF4358 domain-containing protein [Clostridia bacterium]|nr:DUF4358 domain-containing protein [Clostridia bacterium]